MRHLKHITLGLLTLLPVYGSADDALRSFDAGSYQAIVEAHRDRPFILGFWSLDCPPCYRELAELGRWLEIHPGTELVLVSTDENTTPEALQAVLRHHGLEDAENWMVAVPFDTRLRFTIDPLWYGELPRSYLFGADKSRDTISGVLTEKTLAQWWQGNAAATPPEPAM